MPPPLPRLRSAQGGTSASETAERRDSATNKHMPVVVQPVAIVQRLPKKLPASPSSASSGDPASTITCEHAPITSKSPCESAEPPSLSTDSVDSTGVEKTRARSRPTLERPLTQPNESCDGEIEPGIRETSRSKVAGESEKCRSPERGGEFSDHSDIENDFGRVPESVFRAIEDSSDGGGPAPAPRAPGAPAPRRCPACGKLCLSLSGWYHHRRQHGARDFACDTCAARFASRAALGTHARTHTAERPFACRACAARFGSRAGRYIHEQTHAAAGGARHACGACGRAFRWRAALARHEARHGAPRHACDTCARRFAVRSDLRRHERAHRPGQHRCDLCQATFKQIRYLKVHMENIHARAIAPKLVVDATNKALTQPAVSLVHETDKASKQPEKSVPEATAPDKESPLRDSPPSATGDG